ncbi:hypothetical protein SPRG_09011 [Saprolegnia parasitica CBS 223.65]|uniref:Purple acid phosphatase n=1 Tax=Saprolegnia parasitica (strain CBS 223.65) TaxID=695850 RepID=A0A067CG04_SAPPC|nr:hypothetical protein SPRG_09011 [Saprolegnia parasitica CBS 223.65]KDO25712.1 hypothetical protein SPRG_09011 [Saprolegnia parasitica CBS 223.65]|eukprot:XP_012203522.1 hypothetical protein SPRG_09011 [Saprolegnia parasitica CBS 223.65]
MLGRLLLLASSALALRPASQVHLALTNDAQSCGNGVAISFASATPEPYHVHYAPIGSIETWVVSTRPSSSYSVAHGRYHYASPHLHTAYLCQLLPNTQYTYRIHGGDKNSSFYTPPLVGDDTPTVLSVVGDPGDTTESSATLEMLAAPVRGLHPHALLVAGDYAYANGQHEIWDRWFQLQEGVFRSMPTLGIPGNHETVVGSGHAAPRPLAWDMLGENYLGYLQRVVTPLTPESVAAKRTYYSFDVGLVHLVFLDDYVGSVGSAMNSVGTPDWLSARTRQLTWLANDLGRVDRKKTPWVVVIKHNPYYNTWKDHQCQCSHARFEISDPDACWRGAYVQGHPMFEPHCGLQAKLEPLYAQFGVDVVLAGHVHGYERTAPIYQNKIDAVKGTVYVTTGAGGNYEGHAGPRLPGPLPPWSLAVNNQVYGASKLIATRTSLEILWFTNKDHASPHDRAVLPLRPPASPTMTHTKKRVVVAP